MSLTTKPTDEQLAIAAYDDVLARVGRQLAETQKFVAEQNKLIEERLKLIEEGRKLARDRSFIPWQVVATVFGAGTALLVAGATIAKVFLS